MGEIKRIKLKTGKDEWEIEAVKVLKNTVKFVQVSENTYGQKMLTTYRVPLENVEYMRAKNSYDI